MLNKDIDIAQTIEEAAERYNQYIKKDPFPEIEPALLNSADICDYVSRIGMITPFYPENLKPASYGIKMKGEYMYWKTQEDKVCGMIEQIEEKDDYGNFVFTIKKNSIAFVQLEPEFKLPPYIAARFNLKIKHIYQGLLLGTGPLVDPGYEGKLYAPLHNLTNNDYKIRIDLPLIWMEFTKISSNKEWAELYTKSQNRTGEYVSFDPIKKLKKQTLSDYINDAYQNGPIVSTISGFFETTNKTIKGFEDRIKANETSVKETTDGATKVTTQFNRAINFAVVAVSATLVGIIVTLGISINQSIIVHNRAIEYMKDYDKKLEDGHSKYLKEQSDNTQLKEKLFTLDAQVKKINEDIKKLKK